MKISIGLILITMISFSALAQKAVLIEDNGSTTENTRQETKRGSYFTEKKSLKEVFAGEYESTYDMRAKRRVGLGFELAGELGMMGVLAELNLALDDSAIVGFGGGPQYSSFNLSWRHIFGGQSLAPFAGVGYSRWYNNSGGASLWETTPQFLGQKFLSGYEQMTGKFSLNLITPEAGLQYNVLSGPYVGTSFYIKALILLSLSNLQNTITGSVGTTYYF